MTSINLLQQIIFLCLFVLYFGLPNLIVERYLIELSKWKLYMQHFSNTKCMNNYFKLSLLQNPDQFVLQVGPNDLKSKKSTKAIAK